MGYIGKINYILSRKQRLQLAILIIVILLGAILELLGVTSIMPLVEAVTNPAVIHKKQSYIYVFDLLGCKNDNQFITVFVFALIGIYVIKNLFLIFMYNCQYKFTYYNLRIIAMKLIRCYMKQSYLFHVSKNVSELQRNIKEDVNMLFSAILATVQLLAEVTTCCFLVVYLICVDKVISIGVVTILLIFTFFYLKVFKRKTKELGVENRELTFYMDKWIREAFEGIKEIKIANREENYVERIDKAYLRQNVITTKQEVINILPRPIFEAVCISSLLAVVGIKVSLGANLQYFIPVLSAFAIAAFRLLPSFGRIATYLNRITYNLPAIENVYVDLQEIETLKNGEKDDYVNNESMTFADSVRVENITFAYPNMTRNVLENANLIIKKNSSVAIVGTTGGGKSTLVDIILGLLEPQQGHVYVDNNDIYKNLRSWHSLIGYIPQSIYLTDDTIRNNILLGLPEDATKNQQIWEALEGAQLADFVRGLENGLDTVVGERGVRLSGGQRQRIGIARALYSKPQILVLDEATSALDNDTESAVMQAIDALKGNITMIIIAHRLTTIKNCDEVYEVVEGKIVCRDKTEVLEG